MYVALGGLAALGGARPTSIEVLDPVLLGLAGTGIAACAVRARTMAVYVAGGLAAALQPEVVPALLGLAGLGAALVSRLGRRRSVLDACAGGLGWACAVGAPFQAGATPIVVPVLGFGWLVWSAHRHGSARFRQRAGWVLGGVGAVAVVGAGAGLLAVAMARGDMERGADLVERGLRAARAGDTEQAVAHLSAARRSLGQGESVLGAPWARPAWVVPGVSQNARALHTVVSEVDALAAVAIDTADSARLDELQATGGRVDLAAVAAVEAPLEQALGALRTAQDRLIAVGDRWLLDPLRDRIDDVAAELADAIPSAELALDGVRVAPQLLGAQEPATYLVLFASPTEARATTGFTSNYAEVTITDGTYEMTRFGPIRELDLPRGAPDPELDAPADFLGRYARFHGHRDFRNLTMSPDLPTIASVAAQLYERTSGTAVDGVMTIDPAGLAALLELTGPVTLPDAGITVDADNAEAYLLRDQYLEFPATDGQGERKDALETLAEITFERLETVDLPPPHLLGERFGPIVEEGHLRLYAFADGAPSVLDRLGLSGRYPAVVGDFVGVTHTNAAGSKIDLFLERSLDYEATWDPDTGELSATATVTLTNAAPSSGLPAYLIGNALDRWFGDDAPPEGWHKVFLTLYTPWDQVSATLDGQPLLLGAENELDRTALSTFVDLAPGQTRTLVVELAGVLAASDYRLDLAPQPLVTPEEASVAVTVRGRPALDVTGPVTVRDGEIAGRFPLVADVTIRAGPR